MVVVQKQCACVSTNRFAFRAATPVVIYQLSAPRQSRDGWPKRSLSTLPYLDSRGCPCVGKTNPLKLTVTRLVFLQTSIITSLSADPKWSMQYDGCCRTRATLLWEPEMHMLRVCTTAKERNGAILLTVTETEIRTNTRQMRSGQTPAAIV